MNTIIIIISIYVIVGCLWAQATWLASENIVKKCVALKLWTRMDFVITFHWYHMILYPKQFLVSNSAGNSQRIISLFQIPDHWSTISNTTARTRREKSIHFFFGIFFGGLQASLNLIMITTIVPFALALDHR